MLINKAKHVGVRDPNKENSNKRNNCKCDTGHGEEQQRYNRNPRQL